MARTTFILSEESLALNGANFLVGLSISGAKRYDIRLREDVLFGLVVNEMVIIIFMTTIEEHPSRIIHSGSIRLSMV